MRIEAHNGLVQIHDIEATRVVIYDILDNPVSISIQEGRLTHTYHVGDPEFQQVLRECGIHKTLIIHDVRQTPINEVEIRTK